MPFPVFTAPLGGVGRGAHQLIIPDDAMRLSLAALALVLAHLGQNAAFVAVRAVCVNQGRVIHRSAPISCSFDDLAIEAKVAMVRVAKSLGPSEGPLKAPEPRQYFPLTNETMAIIREDYGCLQDLTDESLQEALQEVQAMNN